MYIKTILILAFVAYTKCHDLTVGTNNDGRKIFDEKFEASPALWKQISNVTVNTTDAEVISKVVIEDLRPEKNGEVQIIEGGVDKKNVTIELKSPTALRGYDFHVEVYSITDKNAPVNPSESKSRQDVSKGDDSYQRPTTSTTLRAVTTEKDVSAPVSLEKDIPRQARDTTVPTSATVAPKDLSNTEQSTTAVNSANIRPTNSGFNVSPSNSSTNSQDATEIPLAIGKDLNVNEHRLARDTVNEGAEKTRENNQNTKTISSAGNDQELTSTQASFYVHEYQNKQAIDQKTPFITLNVASTNAPTTETVRNSRDTQKDSNAGSRININGNPITLKDIEDGEKRSQTTETARNSRDTEVESKTEVKIPRFNIGENRFIPTTAKSDDDLTTESTRFSRDTEYERVTDVNIPRLNIGGYQTIPQDYEDDNAKEQTTDNYRNVRGTGDNKSTSSNPRSNAATSATAKNSQKGTEQTRETVRHARDTAEESKTGVNIPRYNVGSNRYSTTPKNAPKDAAQTTDSIRNARDTVEESKTDVNIPRFNVGSNRYSTTPKSAPKDVAQTTENVRNARDTADESKTDINIPRFNVGSSRYSTTPKNAPKYVAQTTETVRNERDSVSEERKTDGNIPIFNADGNRYSTTPKSAKLAQTTETIRNARDTAEESKTEVNIPRFNVNGNRYSTTPKYPPKDVSYATETVRNSRDTTTEVNIPRFNTDGIRTQSTPANYSGKGLTTDNSRISRDTDTVYKNSRNNNDNPTTSKYEQRGSQTTEYTSGARAPLSVSPLPYRQSMITAQEKRDTEADKSKKNDQDDDDDDEDDHKQEKKPVISIQ